MTILQKILKGNERPIYIRLAPFILLYKRIGC